MISVRLRGIDHMTPVREARIAGLCYFLVTAKTRASSVVFTGWGFSLLLFAGFCTLMGVLIFRSKLIPRVIGALMLAAGISYFLNSLSAILSPPLHAALLSGILLPPFIGEFSLALWLTIKGVSATNGRTP